MHDNQQDQAVRTLRLGHGHGNWSDNGGGEANGPYGSSTLWYKIKGYDNGWVANSMLSTGSDLPVTSECSALQEVLQSVKGVAKSMGGWLAPGILVVLAVLVRLRRSPSDDAKGAHSIPLLEKLRR